MTDFKPVESNLIKEVVANRFKCFGEGKEMILPIGPIHPYLKEPIRLKLQTEGERVVKAEIGRAHV